MDNPLVQIEPGLYIWSILTFLGLLVALRLLAWKPLLAALKGRQDAIAKSRRREPSSRFATKRWSCPWRLRRSCSSGTCRARTTSA